VGIRELSPYISATKDVEMTSDLARLGVADAGRPVDLDLVPEHASPFYSLPLRLSGDTRLDHGVEEDLVELSVLERKSPRR
jgi:hypothetical protein